VDASERIDIVAPHPMATVKFKGAKGALVGEAGQGFKLAMRNLDIFRTTVAAAALGFARRALDEALARARDRKMFGQRLGDLQMTQAKLADMATAIDAAALLTYRSAWLKDVKQARVTREAAMAKMQATEAAQRVIDDAVQILGGLGVMRGHPVERLYREVRALRIYEGATEVQKVIIARELLK
jgi:acyl-CoA dehydrogenase